MSTATGRVRIGIYNRHWNTLGGGETQAFGVVDALSEQYDVTLIGPSQIDVEVARERLGVRLEGVGFQLIDDYPATVSMASAEYDLFINHTFRSVDPSLARRSIYFVMFPHELAPESLAQAALRSVVGGRAAPARLSSGVVIDGKGVALVDAALIVAAHGVTEVNVSLDTRTPGSVEVAQPFAAPTVIDIDGPAVVTVPTPGGYGVIAVVGRSERFDVDYAPRITELRVGSQSIAPNPRSLAQRLLRVPSRAFLDTYDAVSANSDYTKQWTQRWWGVNAEVITPPVRMRTPGTKERLILSVGRFFGQEGGHSKRQLEMVEAFRRLYEGGVRDWRLVLIGGSSSADREYAMAVRVAAQGLPIDVRFSAPGDVLDEHFERASIYWHAAGLGADLEKNPDQAEHFGIAPVEAMSAGAVPVVFDAAGPASVVTHGVDGLKYSTLEGLVSSTRQLIDDPGLRQRLASQAMTRSSDFDRAHFEAHVRSFVAGVLEQPPRRG